jgi:hypothetical protein
MSKYRNRVKRYYAQCTDTDPMFRSIWGTAWQIFDRQYTIEGGTVPAICMCTNRTTAFKICDTLNEKETQSKPAA